MRAVYDVRGQTTLSVPFILDFDKAQSMVVTMGAEVRRVPAFRRRYAAVAAAALPAPVLDPHPLSSSNRAAWDAPVFGFAKRLLLGSGFLATCV
jgi:hypothetical protein